MRFASASDFPSMASEKRSLSMSSPLLTSSSSTQSSSTELRTDVRMNDVQFVTSSEQLTRAALATLQGLREIYKDTYARKVMQNATAFFLLCNSFARCLCT